MVLPQLKTDKILHQLLSLMRMSEKSSKILATLFFAQNTVYYDL